MVDKMLGNYKNLALIHLVFPNAIILHTVRDPMDTLFSCHIRRMVTPLSCNTLSCSRTYTPSCNTLFRVTRALEYFVNNKLSFYTPSRMPSHTASNTTSHIPTITPSIKQTLIHPLSRTHTLAYPLTHLLTHPPTRTSWQAGVWTVDPVSLITEYVIYLEIMAHFKRELPPGWFSFVITTFRNHTHSIDRSVILSHPPDLFYFSTLVYTCNNSFVIRSHHHYELRLNPNP